MKIIFTAEPAQIVNLIEKMRELRTQVSQERDAPACFTEIAFSTRSQLPYWMSSDAYLQIAQMLDAERFGAVTEWRREQDKVSENA